MRFTANWFLSVPSERKNPFVKFRLHSGSGNWLQTTRPKHTVSETKTFSSTTVFPHINAVVSLTKIITEMIWASRNGPKIAVIVPYMLNFDRKTFITSWMIRAMHLASTLGH